MEGGCLGLSLRETNQYFVLHVSLLLIILNASVECEENSEKV